MGHHGPRQELKGLLGRWGGAIAGITWRSDRHGTIPSLVPLEGHILNWNGAIAGTTRGSGRGGAGATA